MTTARRVAQGSERNVGRDDLVASAAYQPEPTAAAAARRFVRDTLQAWVGAGADADGHGLVDDAVLLTSELVTNAVVHAGTPVQVTCRVAAGAVEVTVSDGHPARLVPEPAENEHSPAERTSGRGLLLPSALASAWGVTYGRSTKAVWFRLGPAGSAAGLGNGLPDGRDTGMRAEGVIDGGNALATALRSASVSTAGATPATQRGAAAERNGSQHNVSAELSEPSYRTLLASTVEFARVAVAADAAFALMADEDGDLRMRAATGTLPPLADGADVSGLAGPGRASLASVQAAPGADPSVLTVPFLVDGRVTGLLATVCAAPRRFSDAETLRLQRLADTWGPVLQRAWLSELERIRRGRIGALAEARGLLMGGLARDEIMAMLGRAAVPRLAPWCAVFMRMSGTALRPEYLRHADRFRAKALGWLLDRVCCTVAADPSWWQQAGLGAALRLPLAVPGDGAPRGADELAAGAAWCFPFGGPGNDQGLFVIGSVLQERLPREVAALTADLACRIGLALAGSRVVSK